ncbi:hypothetical protein M1512_02935 [Patescibacteria group bacterium]|nr:hypothetical protein [Patescibacteria group bacterium]
MTQFNLLPAIKIEYLKAKKLRQIVISVSVLITIAAIVLVGILFSLTALQKSQINSLTEDIKHQGLLLSDQTNLDEILTIQNQIKTLTKLHEQEPNVDNLAGYLYQTIPTTVSLSSLSIDFNTDLMSLSGNANSLVTVNQLIDSLKFATFSINGVTSSKPAFSNIILSDFGVAQTGTSQQASNSTTTTFTINLNFNKELFNNTLSVKLTVPSKVTTRSQLDQPTVLFQQRGSK